MNRRIVLILMIMIIGITGCGKEQDFKNSSSKLEEATVHNEPLVMQELVFDDKHLVQVLIYVYDDKNRYKEISVYEGNDKDSFKLTRTMGYEYDDNSYYIMTTDNLNEYCTLEKYDEHKNIISEQVGLDENHLSEPREFEYLYEKNDKNQEVETCIFKNNQSKLYSTTTEYNEYGDKVYYRMEYQDKSHYEQFLDYEYDSEGNITCIKCREDNNDNINEYTRTYEYNDKNKIKASEETGRLNIDSDMEIKYQEDRSYIYDDEDRLLSIESQKYNNKSREHLSEYTKIYQYEPKSIEDILDDYFE